MSVILSWETPAELFALEKMAYKTRVSRTLFPARPVNQPETVLTESSTWGVFEDNEIDDPTTAGYRISYIAEDGNLIRDLSPPEIRVWTRPGESLKLNLCCIRPDSSPWVGRRLKFTNVPTESFNRDLYTNVDGMAMVILAWDWRIRMIMEGWERAFEFTVPRTQEISVPRLMRFGSWTPLERRGIPS